MKKFLALIMVLVLMFSFAACANPEGTESPAVSGDTAEPDTSPSPEPSTDTEDMPSIGFVIMGVGNEFFQQMADLFMQVMTEAGWAADYADGQFDPTVQMEAVENFTAMGKDVIVILPVSGEALSSAVESAREAGVKVISMVNPTATYDACMVSDPALVAEGMCELAAEWVDEAFPDAETGSIGVAILAYTADENSVITNEALKEVESYSPKFRLDKVYEIDEQTSEAGMTAAESIYTTNPDVQVYLCCDGSNALGVHNYFTGLSSPVEDLSTIGVFGGSTGSEEIYSAIRDSADDTSVYRGLCVASGVDATIAEILELATGLMDGTFTEPVNRKASVEKISPKNVAGYLA